MDLHVLFMQRKERYEGEFGPEALVCWDEYTIHENPEGFEKEVDQQKDAFKNDAAGFALVKISVDGEKVRSMCLDEDHHLEGRIRS